MTHTDEGLLREEVKFGNQSSKVESSAEEKTWHLLSLKLFREYLDFEFGPTLRKTLKFEYDLERLIDDWILLGYFVGNDFMPHLPNFHIGEDIKPFIYESYKKVLAKCDGWITDRGDLNLERLEVLMLELSKFDYEFFNQSYTDLQWMGEGSLTTEEGGGGGGGGGDDAAKTAKAAAKAEKEELFEAELRANKSAYYSEKMHIENPDDPEFLKGQAQGYVTGLQWCLWYYYRGVPSWGWFFPSHYAPFVSDIRGFKDFKVTLDKGKPFLPFQQLMSVLPRGSMQHIPPGLTPLMTEAESPILDFYPTEFASDLNGKKQDWEALVLIPFIDESRLLPAMAAREQFLTKAEKGRNIHSKAIQFNFDVSSEATYPFAGPGFESFRATVKSKELPFPHNPFATRPKQLCDGVDLVSHLEGFPSFSHLGATGQVKKANVNIFGRPSRNESIVVKLGKQATVTPELVGKYLGSTVWVRVPHLVEAIVVGVSSATEYVQKKVGKKAKVTPKSGGDRAAWVRQANTIQQDLMAKQGIDAGQITHLVHVCIRAGKTIQFGDNGKVTTQKRFDSSKEHAFAFQTVNLGLPIYNAVADEVSGTVAEWFPVGSDICYLGHPYYGSLGTVMKVDPTSGKVAVTLRTRGHPQLPPKALQRPNFMSIGDAARRCGIHGMVLGRLIANVFVFNGSKSSPGTQKTDVGLKWKFNRSETMVAGITERRADGKWLISQKGVEHLKEYKAKFSELIDGLSKYSKDYDFYQEDIFPTGNADGKLKDVKKWLKALPPSQGPYVPCGSQSINDAGYAAVEMALDGFAKTEADMSMMVHPRLLQVFGQPHLPSTADTEVGQDLRLGDRVLCVHESPKAPLYGYGNVTALHGTDLGSGISVVFDEKVNGGNSLDGRVTQGRGACVPARWLLNVSGAHRAKGMALPTAKRGGGGGDSGGGAAVGVAAQSRSDMMKAAMAAMPAMPMTAPVATAEAAPTTMTPVVLQKSAVNAMAKAANADPGQALLAMLKAGVGVNINNGQVNPMDNVAAQKALKAAQTAKAVEKPLAEKIAKAPRTLLPKPSSGPSGPSADSANLMAMLGVTDPNPNPKAKAKAKPTPTPSAQGRSSASASASAAIAAAAAALPATSSKGAAVSVLTPEAVMLKQRRNGGKPVVPQGPKSAGWESATIRAPAGPSGRGKGFGARTSSSPAAVNMAASSSAPAADEDLDEYADMWKSLMAENSEGSSSAAATAAATGSKKGGGGGKKKKK